MVPGLGCGLSEDGAVRPARQRPRHRSADGDRDRIQLPGRDPSRIDRAKAALLGLIQDKVRTPGGAEALLAHFAGEAEPQRHIAHAILRHGAERMSTGTVLNVDCGEFHDN